MLHSKPRFNAASMILVGVALFVLLNGVLETLAQSPLMKTPQGLIMKIWSDVYILVVSALLGLILALLLSPKLNLPNLDDIQARSIGFNIDRYRWLTGLLAVFLTSATVAIVGQLVLLGIIVPHATRKLVGGNYRILIPFSTVIGAWLLSVADLLGRVIQPPLEVPANAILMIVGGPMLIYLVCRSQRNWV